MKRHMKSQFSKCLKCHSDRVYFDLNQGKWIISCRNCGNKTGAYSDVSGAIAEWDSNNSAERTHALLAAYGKGVFV